MLYSKRRKNFWGGGVENAPTESIIKIICGGMLRPPLFPGYACNHAARQFNELAFVQTTVERRNMRLT
jgi:hypothetical protein